MENPRNQISDMHFENSQTHQTSSVGRPISRLKCAPTQGPTIAMLWIKEVEVAKSVDNFMTSQSSEGRDFFDFEMLDAKIASAWKRIISNQYFRRRVNVEEQAAHKYGKLLL